MTSSQSIKQFVDLHEQVETSVYLLDSLESFLSTFQTDLSSLSGQISTLQDRSTDIENRLKARKKIEKPLSGLLTELCIAPALAITILDTDVGEPWLTVIPDFEQRLRAVNSRKRVKAARDLSEVAEGLRLAAVTKIRGFFMTMIQPIRTSMTTNMQILQSSVLLKYRPLYGFLQNQAADVAKEIQRAYTTASRVYFETGFRRYTRSLTWVKARTAEKHEALAAMASDDPAEPSTDESRLAYAKIDGPPITITLMAEEKSHKQPLEALLRSCILVLMDNATAEHRFLSTFFAPLSEGSVSPQSDHGPMPSPMYAASALDERESTQRRRDSLATIDTSDTKPHSRTKEEQADTTATWKQIMEPTLSHCQSFVNAVLEPPPPVIPLLTMIRLIEDVLEEVQRRDCPPLENWLFGVRMQLWPVFQKLMTEHVSSVNKLSEAATGGYFRRVTMTNETTAQGIANLYVAMFASFVLLTPQPEETVIFSNLTRLRHEVTQLVLTHSKRLADPLASATYQSTMFESLLRAMSKGQHSMAHPKVQAELAYWREREEQARRRLTSNASRPNQ